MGVVFLVGLLGVACGDSSGGPALGCEGPCGALNPTPATTGDLGRYTSSALTPDGRRVIATYDSTYGNLVVLYEPPPGPGDAPAAAPAAERTQILDGWAQDDQGLIDTDAGRWTDVAVADDGTMHVVWYDTGNGQLKHAASDGSSPWKVGIVDGHGPSARGTHASIAVSDAGALHIAYRDETSRALRYARQDAAGSWVAVTVDGCAGEADCPSLSEDLGEHADIVLLGERPRIAFYDRGRGDLKMTTREADGVWRTTTLDGRDPFTGADTGDVGRFVSLALTPSSFPAVAYFDATRGALRYLVAGSDPIVVDDGVWTHPDSGAVRSHVVGQHASLRFDRAGRAIILYLDAGRLELKRAVVSGTSVVAVERLEDLAPGGFLGFDFDADGAARGAYGAWLAGAAPRTRLVRLELPAVSQ